MTDLKKIPAAQYLRMSTEHQQYSIPYQVAAISKYADQNGFVVIRTYADPGCSGLLIRNRPGLRALLQDVTSGSTDYKAILVYDVSRWGRFQDCDEAAHYEFLCRTSGVAVHYCAEQFTNDMAPVNIILKWMKRTMAAEYSRELSAKTYSALRRAAEQGYRLGSTPGYGFRRMLIAADGTPKQLLQDGEQKSVRTDRIKLVLGPPEEIKVVRLIYQMLICDRMGPTGIARELTRRGIPFQGGPWSFATVKRILTDAKYCGVQIWGRFDKKLRCAPRRLSNEQWVTAPTRGPQIVDEHTFAQAQQAYLHLLGRKTNDQLLTSLRHLLNRHGYLSRDVIDNAKTMPSTSTYFKRFGSLRNAYQLIGYSPQQQHVVRHRHTSWRRTARIRRDLARRLQLLFPGRIVAGDYDGYVRCPQLGVNVVLSICRTCPGYTSWYVPWRRQQLNAMTLLCLLNKANDRIDGYYIFPRLPGQHRLRICNDRKLLSYGKKLFSLRDFYRAVTEAQEQLSRDKLRGPEKLVGITHIARYLGRSLYIVHRLLDQGMPATRERRCVIAVRQQLDEWMLTEGENKAAA